MHINSEYTYQRFLDKFTAKPFSVEKSMELYNPEYSKNIFNLYKYMYSSSFNSAIFASIRVFIPGEISGYSFGKSHCCSRRHHLE